ncbi:DUF4935 domain-containing protein [Patescibacteria group bacterium]|nr:DUF4935 domain-containing protein [Patescibacteria group bacterium]
MVSEQKTWIVFDTNFLMIQGGKGISYSSFEFSQDFDSIKEFIELHDLSEKIELATPKIVIEELKTARIYYYREDSKSMENKFKSFSDLDSALLSIPRTNPDYKALLERLIDAHLDKVKIRIIDHPPEKCFKSILNRAIDKQRPFIVTDNHSDYGFKDVVLWESILNHNGLGSYGKVILMTGDKKAFDDKCSYEFESKFGIPISIYRSKGRALEEISKYYDVVLEHTEYLKFAKSNYFRETLEFNLTSKNKITLDDEELEIKEYSIIDQFISLTEEKDESNEKTGSYIITSMIKVYFEENGTEREGEVNVETCIDEDRDVQYIRYEPDLI